MRSTKVVSISLPLEMLEKAEALAKEENRTMSELVREALRAYQRERSSWKELFAYGEANARKLGVKSEEDVVRIIREHRAAKGRNKGDRKTGTK